MSAADKGLTSKFFVGGIKKISKKKRRVSRKTWTFVVFLILLYNYVGDSSKYLFGPIKLSLFT
jgi:hypothetical protein